MSVLGDRMFQQYCNILNINHLVPSDPDKRQIEKAFRKCALKTHPDKPGGNAIEFRRINDAYNRLIAHATKLEAIEAEAELTQSSVIIEISKQAVNTWSDRLRISCGRPRCSNVKNVIFEGPYKQFRGRGGHIGPITVVLYEDPEDAVPKLHVRCENYIAWMQQGHHFPIHLHVENNKKIMFDQWRIMSMAEFGFCKVKYGTSARHDWKQTNFARAKHGDGEEQERQQGKTTAKSREEEVHKEEECRSKQEEAGNSSKKHKIVEPWWMRHSGGIKDFHIGETTPPPEDFPAYDPETNSYTYNGKKEPSTGSASTFMGPSGETSANDRKSNNVHVETTTESMRTDSRQNGEETPVITDQHEQTFISAKGSAKGKLKKADCAKKKKRVKRTDEVRFTTRKKSNSR